MSDSVLRRIPRLSLLVILGTVLAGAVLAQTEENKIYLLDPGGTLRQLALETGTIKSTTSVPLALVGVSKAKTWTDFPGTRAAVRLSASEVQTFVIGTTALGRLPDHLDPSVFYTVLTGLDINRKAGTRESLFLAAKGFLGINKISKASAGPLGIPLNFSRYDDHAVRIQPRSPLARGEYAFMAVGGRDPYAAQNQLLFYCFGID